MSEADFTAAGSTAVDLPPEGFADVVWGTDVSPHPFSASVSEHFWTYFAPDDPIVPFYPKMMMRLFAAGGQLIDIDISAMRNAPYDNVSEAADQLVRHPHVLLPFATQAARRVWKEICNRSPKAASLGPPPAGCPPLERRWPWTVRAYNVGPPVSLRVLSPAQLDTLVTVDGMVTRVGRVVPEITQGHFECVVCKATKVVGVVAGSLNAPKRCRTCGKGETMSLVFNRSVYDNTQVIKVQECVDTIPTGEAPATVSLRVLGPLVDAVAPGDRVCVTAVFSAVPVRASAESRVVHAVQRTVLDGVHIVRLRGASSKAASDETVVWEGVTLGAASARVCALLPATGAAAGDADEDADLIVRMERFARRRDVYDVLARSVAPSVYGLQREKEAILCLLFGGCRKVFSGDVSGACMPIRGEIHVLLCGDPGVAKSQLLSQIYRIAPRGVFTGGKGSSTVGLTAFVSRDEETGEFVLESGALALSDGGVCCIDEFDKMAPDSRSVLHEAMEQQTISVAKAGIVATLNARTAVLAAANPVGSQWDAHLTVSENIDVEPTLLSRFDVICLLVDHADVDADRKLARHIIKIFAGRDSNAPRPAAAAAAAAVAPPPVDMDALDDDDGAMLYQQQQAALHGHGASAADDAAASAVGGTPRRPRRSRAAAAAAAADVDLLGTDGLGGAQDEDDLFALGVGGDGAGGDDDDDDDDDASSDDDAYVLPLAVLARYVAHARKHVRPRLTAEACNALRDIYVSLRRGSGAAAQGVGCTPRQLEALIRLAEARARMRLAATVTGADVAFAKELLHAALRTWAVDPDTGLIDMSKVRGVDSAAPLEVVVRRMADFCRGRARAGAEHVHSSALIGLFRRSAYDRSLLEKAIELLPTRHPDLVGSIEGDDVTLLSEGARAARREAAVPRGPAAAPIGGFRDDAPDAFR